ncbi:MAG: septum formation initiator family protein [Treponema sp.]|nr:septum formation initiator family protein [Treponema sp.]
MKRFRFLCAALAGTFVYVLISLSGGRDGFWAKQQLQEQKRLLSARTQEIQNITDSLELEFKALDKDPDVIAAFARKLGYIKSGEKIVKINGLDSDTVFHFKTGIPLKATEPYTLPEWFCKGFALVVFVIVYVLLILDDYRKGRFTKKRTTVQGIPIYDLPQV